MSVGLRFFLLYADKSCWRLDVGGGRSLVWPGNEAVESLRPSRTVHEGPPSCICMCRSCKLNQQQQNTLGIRNKHPNRMPSLSISPRLFSLWKPATTFVMQCRYRHPRSTLAYNNMKKQEKTRRYERMQSTKPKRLTHETAWHNLHPSGQPARLSG
jgi:hypothetical protein